MKKLIDISIIVPTDMTADDGDDHAPKVQAIIDAFSQLGYDFIDYGVQKIEYGEFWSAGDTQELCFSSRLTEDLERTRRPDESLKDHVAELVRNPHTAQVIKDTNRLLDK